MAKKSLIENFGLRAAFAINDFFAISFFYPCIPRLSSERHSQALQKGASLFVIARGSDDRDVHPAQLVDVVEIDLRKDQLLANSDRVVAAAIESLRRNTAKVAHARQRHRYESIEKLIHSIATQREDDADRHSLAQLERRDRLLRFRDHRLLSGDGAQLVGRRVENLRV